MIIDTNKPQYPRRWKKRRKKRKNKRLMKLKLAPYIEWDENKQSNDKVRNFYKGFEWKKLRYETLLRYGKKCMCCGAKKGVFNVDHIKPVRKYWDLRLDPENVQVLCNDCNHGKGNWDQTDHRPKTDPFMDFLAVSIDKFS